MDEILYFSLETTSSYVDQVILMLLIFSASQLIADTGKEKCFSERKTLHQTISSQNERDEQ